MLQLSSVFCRFRFHGETFEEIWKDMSEDDSEIVHEHLSASSIPLSPLNDPLPSTDPSIRSLVLWLTGFLLLIQARYFTSDAIIDALLKFLCVFFKVLGHLSQFAAKLAIALPSSICMLQKTTKDCSRFAKYVVCQKCHRLYRFDDCSAISEGQLASKKMQLCSFPKPPT